MGWRLVIWVIVGAALAAIVVPLVAGWRWRQQSTRLRVRLEAAAAPVSPAPQDASAELPAPVARYLRKAVPAGQPDIALVELEQEGDFRTGAGDDGWRPFTATQKYSTDPPGFVWDARIRMAPLLPVFVRDAFVDGRGSMQASILGLIRVVDQSGQPALAAGALSRYLAEAVWFPTMLRPGRGVTWSPLDARAARATIAAGTTVATVEFRFDEDDDIVEVYAPDRFREVDGRYEPTPWAVRCTDHESREGLRVPTRCEVAWQLPDGPWPYWRGRLTAVRYEPAR